MLTLNDLLQQRYLIYIEYYIPNWKNVSNAHKTFSRIGHMLGHETDFNKFKIKMLLSIFSKNNEMKLEINYKRKIRR